MPEPIRAQRGPQEQALASAANIVIFGGSAGGGKSWGALLSVVQHAHIPGFAAEIFRRTYPQLTMTGGLWPESYRVFPHLGAEPRESDLSWTFPSGARVKFSHMQYAKDRFNWDGAQVPMLAFDQLESFEEEQWWYLLSRNRDPHGVVEPWVFCTCNPVPEDDPTGGWVHKFVQWWIDPTTGLAIEARSGRLRWVLRRDDGLHWATTRQSLLAEFPGSDPKSLTFIRSLLDDNPALLVADPGYRGRLMLLPLHERLRLLGANWNARAEAGDVFNRGMFAIIAAVPREARRVRYWDKAGTEAGGAYSAGVRMAEHDGRYYVEDVVRGQWGSAQRNAVMLQVAAADGVDVPIWVEQEPGSGGKESAELSVQLLAGYAVRAETVTGDKVTRANPLAAQVQAGNVRLLSGEWNEPYLVELHAFPDGRYKDQVDASSGAFNKLALGAGRMEISATGAGRSVPERRRVVDVVRG